MNISDIKVTSFMPEGMLLYARIGETIQPDNEYQMSGNRIRVKTLDLNRDFSKIASQLNTIVDVHFA